MLKGKLQEEKMKNDEREQKNKHGKVKDDEQAVAAIQAAIKKGRQRKMLLETSA